jgi:hypothetical protein
VTANNAAAIALESSASTENDRRLLILAPTKKDGIITEALLLDTGIRVMICASLDELIAAIEDGAAAVLVAEEFVSAGGQALADVISRLPAWSDLPVLVLTRPRR